MKRLVVLSIVVFMLAGCAGIQIKQDVADMVEIMAARRLAFELAKQDPGIIKPGIIICDSLIGSVDPDETENITLYAIEKLTEYVGNDPLLKQDLTDLLNIIEIETPGGQIDIPKLKKIATGFKQGLLMAQRKVSGLNMEKIFDEALFLADLEATLKIGRSRFR